MTTKRNLITAITGVICLLAIYACLPNSAVITTPTQTITFTPMSTSIITPTLIPTSTEISTPQATPVNATAENACQLSIRGTYNFPKGIDTSFTLGPDRYFFYNRPGGGRYGNDQAGCELNEDCTKLRAINKDSAEPNPEGVLGSWVDSQSGTSIAQWRDFIVKCSLAPAK